MCVNKSHKKAYCLRLNITGKNKYEWWSKFVILKLEKKKVRGEKREVGGWIN